MGLDVIKGWFRISSKVNLLQGSRTSILDNKIYSTSYKKQRSGKLNSHWDQGLYDDFTSEVSNGGFPINRVYIITPTDQISA